MAVKTVTLREDAYDALASLKGESESFSDIVRRLAGSRTPLSAFAGAWMGAPEEEIESVRKFLRESDRISRRKLRRLGPGVGRRG